VQEQAARLSSSIVGSQLLQGQMAGLLACKWVQLGFLLTRSHHVCRREALIEANGLRGPPKSGTPVSPGVSTG